MEWQVQQSVALANTAPRHQACCSSKSTANCLLPANHLAAALQTNQNKPLTHVHHIFSLWVDLHQHLVLPHQLKQGNKGYGAAARKLHFSNKNDGVGSCGRRRAQRWRARRLPSHLDHFAYIAARLLQQLQLFSQQPNCNQALSGQLVVAGGLATAGNVDSAPGRPHLCC